MSYDIRQKIFFQKCRINIWSAKNSFEGVAPGTGVRCRCFFKSARYFWKNWTCCGGSALGEGKRTFFGGAFGCSVFMLWCRDRGRVGNDHELCRGERWELHGMTSAGRSRGSTAFAREMISDTRFSTASCALRAIYIRKADIPHGTTSDLFFLVEDPVLERE